MAQVFISHIEEEESIAAEIARGLEDSGYSVWYYERDSYPGADYLDQVSAAIETCDVLLVLISPDSVTSRQIEDEVKWARELRKSFVPVVHRMSWIEFENRKPRWRMALGLTAGVTIRAGGVGAILPRILKGFEKLGVKSNPVIESETNEEPAKKDHHEGSRRSTTDSAPDLQGYAAEADMQPPPSAVEVEAALDRILQSSIFRSASRHSRLLHFLVRKTLSGKRDEIKEHSIGVEVFDRPIVSFDPATDPIVRSEVRRLRVRLAEYYRVSGFSDPVKIDVPKGTYIPIFSRRSV